ncbi:MAG: ThuA domain-containing protein [Pirellulales bacterium]
MSHEYTGGVRVRSNMAPAFLLESGSMIYAVLPNPKWNAIRQFQSVKQALCGDMATLTIWRFPAAGQRTNIQGGLAEVGCYCPPAYIARSSGMAMKLALVFTVCLWGLVSFTASTRAADPWVVFEGGEGPGAGKHIVLVSGDEEYRSEETLPQLGKILSRRHGFKCTVLFAVNPQDGTIDPNINNNIPGLEALKTADLMVVFLRFRNLPDEQMRHFVEYVESGKPVVGLRTATHSFNIGDANATYARYSFQNKDFDGGFGRQVLGETWINHHGAHGSQSTRGILVPEQKEHPILRGLQDGDIWGPTDVYTVRLPLPESCQPLVLGQVLEGMQPEDKPLAGEKNEPMMPVAWTNTYHGAEGQDSRVFCTTMGASQDLLSAGLRRLLVNACYWAVGLEGQINGESNVDIVGKYEPLPFGFGADRYKHGVKPEDHLSDE